jgi:hypothetical protein
MNMGAIRHKILQIFMSYGNVYVKTKNDGVRNLPFDCFAQTRSERPAQKNVPVVFDEYPLQITLQVPKLHFNFPLVQFVAVLNDERVSFNWIPMTDHYMIIWKLPRIYSIPTGTHAITEFVRDFASSVFIGYLSAIKEGGVAQVNVNFVDATLQVEEVEAGVI